MHLFRLGLRREHRTHAQVEVLGQQHIETLNHSGALPYAKPALATTTCDQVSTGSTPPRLEGCRSASRGLTLDS